MKLIVQVQLQPDIAQRNSLLATMRAFNAACDWLAARAMERKVFTHFRLQSAHYHDIRNQFGLSAQAACLVCAKVADAFAISKTPRKFRPLGSVIYDLRLLSWNLDKSMVSIWAVPSRLSMPFVCGEKQRKFLGYPRGQTDLIYRDGKFFLHVTVDLPDVAEKSVMDMLGVDMGVACLAYDSDNNKYSGTHLNRARHRNNALRRKLQKKGTKSSKRLLKKRGNKERRFAANTNHIISKRIVTLAEHTGRGIALENLKGIRARIRAKRDQRYRLHSWPFAQLGAFIVYKAERAGMPVVFVDPKHTSQRCSACDHTEKANRLSRDRFVCKKCGHADHADGNGAKNIRLLGLNVLGSGVVIRPNAEVISCAQ